MAVKTIRHTRFEALCRAADAVPGWPLDFAQLEGGRCDGEILSVRNEPFHFMQVRVDKSVRRSGRTPAGQVSLAIHAAPRLTSRTHGATFGDDVLVMTPGGSRLEGVSLEETNLFALSVDEEAFAAMLEATGCPVEEPRPGAVRLLVPSAEAVAGLRRAMWHLREAALRGRSDDAAWEPVCAHMLACLASLGDPGLVPPDTTRLRALHHSLGYIRENLASPLKLEDICRTAGVSERTLIYAFKQHMGVTPKAYMNICRLNMVRREMECGRVPTITDAATRWGFWHMGQFSADYKRFFGELPSQTLSRTRGRSVEPDSAPPR